MEKIKICYVISSLANQGPPNVLYNIIKYMDFSRFEVSIITMINEPESTRIDDFRKLPINIVQMSPDKAQNPLSMFLTLRKMVRSLDPDILHTHCPRSMFMVPLLSKRYIKAETVHIYPGLQQKVMYGNLAGSVVIALSHFFTRRMDYPIACSESVAESYLREKHLTMQAIPNGCSMPVWHYNEAEKSRLRQEFGMQDGIRYFIFIGRFSHEKHPELIVKAFKRLAGTGVGVVMLGDGPMYDELRSHAGGNILMPGFTTRVYDYLKASDYYISASDVEGLANTLLESMSVGLPGVLSDIPSHREVIAKTSDVLGYAYDNSSVDNLINAINEIIKLDLPSTRESIQRLYEDRYTAYHMSRQYQDAYEAMISSRNRR